MRFRSYVHHNVSDSNYLSFSYQNHTSLLEVTKQKISEHFNALPTYVIIIIAVIFVILGITVLICILKLRTRRKYEKNPQNFTKKPSLSIADRLMYKKAKIITPLGQQLQQITKKSTYGGQFHEIKISSQSSAIYYKNILNKDCYFEIQIIKLNSYVQIGFVPVDSIKQVFDRDSAKNKMYLYRFAVGLGSDGEVNLNGQMKFNINWTLEYGDIIGIGLTKHKNNVRAWITKNGKIVNSPTPEDILANTEFQEENKQPDQTEDHCEEAVQHYSFKKGEKSKKIELKSSHQFNYYAAIVSEGASYDSETIINWNLGAHTFRMFDGNSLKGIIA